MAPFRWPELSHDKALLLEVAAKKPERPTDWEDIALNLSLAFCTPNNAAEIKGQACRERLDCLIHEFKNENVKALKRLATEEAYSEIKQLLQDILDYRKDMKKEKMAKKRKAEEDCRKGEDMRQAALVGLAKTRLSGGTSSNNSDGDNEDDDDDGALGSAHCAKGSKKKPHQRASKMSAFDVLSDKTNRKFEIKQQELEVRRMELEFQKRNYEAEAEERKARVELDREERKAMLELLKDHLS